MHGASDRWIRASPPVLILALLAFLATTMIAVAGPVRSAVHWWQFEHHWREREYEQLTALRAGYTITKFEEALGAPVFRRLSDDERWEETTFRGRDYWVQAVARSGTGTTSYFAVTSCSLNFNPTFVLPDGSTITLNELRLSQVRLSDVFGRPYADYFAPAATANARFLDFAYGGNPANYKSFAWGYNDACLNLPGWTKGLNDDVFQAFGLDGTFQGLVPNGNAALENFRGTLFVNTYAESSPGDDFATGPRGFQVGVDRILIRTVTPEYQPRTDTLESSSRHDPFWDASIMGSRRMNAVARCFESPLQVSFSSIISGRDYGYAPDEEGVLGSCHTWVVRSSSLAAGSQGGRRTRNSNWRSSSRAAERLFHV